MSQLGFESGISCKPRLVDMEVHGFIICLSCIQEDFTSGPLYWGTVANMKPSQRDTGDTTNQYIKESVARLPVPFVYPYTGTILLSSFPPFERSACTIKKWTVQSKSLVQDGPPRLRLCTIPYIRAKTKIALYQRV